jgi:tetraacyldisaccharide 4'-kinase
VPLAFLYKQLINLRNGYYDRRKRASRAAPVPVISVGNLTVGGTGKTPIVIELARKLLRLGHHPAILTRGYGPAVGGMPDEVAELRTALPQVPVIVQPDRVAGAMQACAQYEIDCLLLDDGFQHRRLRRDLDIVLIDALDPLGNGWLLPAGRLREPPQSLRRAHWLIITRSNQVSPQRLAEITAMLRRYASAVPITPAPVVAERLVGMNEAEVDLRLLGGRRILAVCGLGNPRSFLLALEGVVGGPVTALRFADHHAYRKRDVRRIVKMAGQIGAEWVVTTRKDWVKLRWHWSEASAAKHRSSGLPELYRLESRLVPEDPGGELDARLAGLFGKAP